MSVWEHVLSSLPRVSPPSQPADLRFTGRLISNHYSLQPPLLLRMGRIIHLKRKKEAGVEIERAREKLREKRQKESNRNENGVLGPSVDAGK